MSQRNNTNEALERIKRGVSLLASGANQLGTSAEENMFGHVGQTPNLDALELQGPTIDMETLNALLSEIGRARDNEDALANVARFLGNFGEILKKVAIS